MVTDGEVLTKNKVKELLRSATPPRGKRWKRDSFFFAGIAIVALVALTAISYRPSEAMNRALRPHTLEETGSVLATAEREPLTVTQYPLTTVVKVVLESGAELYLEHRTAAMLGAVKLTKAEATGSSW